MWLSFVIVVLIDEFILKGLRFIFRPILGFILKLDCLSLKVLLIIIVVDSFFVMLLVVKHGLDPLTCLCTILLVSLTLLAAIHFFSLLFILATHDSRSIQVLIAISDFSLSYLTQSL